MSENVSYLERVEPREVRDVSHKLCILKVFVPSAWLVEVRRQSERATSFKTSFIRRRSRPAAGFSVYEVTLCGYDIQTP